MTDFTPMLDPLLQAASDSAATRIVIERGWIATVASVGQAVVSLLVMIMLGMIVAMLFALKKSLDELTKLIKTSAAPVHDLLQDARATAHDVRALTTTVQAPVVRLAATVDEAGGRMRHALARAEHRLERLDALVGIVQDEAEELVVRAGSTVRGLSVGTAAVRALFFGRATSSAKKRRADLRRRRERRALAARAMARRERAESHGPSRPSDVPALKGPRIRPRPASTP